MKEILENINRGYEVYITYVDKTTGIPTGKTITPEIQEHILNLLNNDKTTNSK